MTGIESLVVLRDVCGLEHPEARGTMGWAVRTLVEAALREGEVTEAPSDEKNLEQ